MVGDYCFAEVFGHYAGSAKTIKVQSLTVAVDTGLKYLWTEPYSLLQ
jgi:hypothetical protein